MSNNFTSGMAGPLAVETLNLLWDRVTEQIVGNSTTSLAIGTGTKTLTIEASKQFAIGQTARITYNSDVGKWMQGTVSAYNATTGSLSISVDTISSSGTYAVWTVALTGSVGPTGATGATGATGPTGATGATGPANTLSIGTVTEGAAAATITGTAPNQTLNLVVPKGNTGATGSTGPAGPANSLSIGTVTEGAAAATITGTAPTQTLNLVVPKGNTGATGATGSTGPEPWSAPVAWAGSTAYVATAPASCVTYLGETYVCTTGHTSTGTFDASKFVKIAQKGADGTGSGSVTDVAALTLGTTGTDLSSSVANGTTTPVITLNVPTASATNRGALSAADWSTFNGKQAALGFTPENSANKGAAGGYAPLDGSAKIASTYLPSYVDDVLEYANQAAFPGTGETGKIYVALDVNKTFRWSGSAYVEISASPGSTDAVTEGSTNLYFLGSRVLATVLSGLSTASNTVVTASHTILQAIGFLKKQVSDLTTASSTTTFTNKTLTSPTLTAPVLGTPAGGDLSNCTADGANAVGFRTIPQNSQSTAYTAVLADSGKHILHPSADTTARTMTIPANSSVAYPIGTALTFVNQNGAGVMTIAITTDTMRLAGAGTTGSRTLAANGIATALKVTSTEWIISGTGLT